MKIITLTDKYDNYIAINADEILSIKHTQYIDYQLDTDDEPSYATLITTKQNHSIYVVDTVEEIVKKLEQLL